MPSHPVIMLVVLLLSLVSDQLSKQLVVSRLELHQIIEVIPGVFNLTLTYNHGVAFGMFADLPPGLRGFILVGAILLALTVITFFLLRYYFDSLIGQIAVALILGGAAGNIIDRVRLGAVIDFLDFYWSNYHWPAFNVADSCVCVGVFFLLLIPSPKRSLGQVDEAQEVQA